MNHPTPHHGPIPPTIPPPPPTAQGPDQKTPWAAILVALVFLYFVGTFMVRTFAWADRGCDLPTSAVSAISHGEPDPYEYCQ